ncbi:MAG: hypothetical protein QGF09_04645, partial [Rhodospirillales bacterium]|nr:hypothetical protein [Rhodospirillales bacterium]
MIEAVIFVFLAKKFEADRLAEIENSGIAWTQVILRVDSNVMDGPTVDMASRERPADTKILGFTLFDGSGSKEIGHFGKAPSLAPGRGGADFVRARRSEDGAIYETVWDPAILGGAFTAVAVLNTSSLPGEIRAFAWRAGGSVLVVSIVGTLAAILVLGFLVFSPIINLRAHLISADSNPGGPENHLIDATPSDELGGVAEAFNDMIRRLASGISRIRSNEKKFQDSNNLLER